MTEAFKQRITGAVFLISSAVIFIPNILDGNPSDAQILRTTIPKPFEVPHIQSNMTNTATTMQPTQTVAPIQQQLAQTSPNTQPWSIQLGSFLNADRAQQLAQTLSSQGYAVYTRVDPDTTFTQVFIGPEVSKASALALASRLQQEISVLGAVVPFENVGMVQTVKS